MSAPEEIVCETEEGFREACLQYGAATEWPHLRSGQVTHGTVISPVRIVYRPPPPRDEAEDAFRKWAMSGGAYALDRITFTDPDMDRQYRAFLAGRASVKP